MAGNLTDDFGAFDNNAERNEKAGAGLFFSRLFSFLTNRFLVLGVGFVTFGVIILIMTTRLQFSDYQNTLSESSSVLSDNMFPRLREAIFTMPEEYCWHPVLNLTAS